MAVIEHADPNVSVARVNVGSQLQTMSDAAVLDLFNAMMGVQENLAAEFDSTAVEIPPGKPSSRSTPRFGALSAPAATSPVTRPPRSCYISFSIMRPRRGNVRRGNGSRPKHSLDPADESGDVLR